MDNLKARGKLQDNAGNVIAEFDIPSSLYDVPLNRYVDFLVEVGKSTPENAILQHTKAVSAFYGVDLLSLLNGVYNTEKEKTDFEMATVSQLHGYAAGLIDKHISGMFANPKVSTYEPFFQFNGQTFGIPKMLTDVMSSGTANLPGLSVIESIEAMEANRLFETQQDNDEDGSLLFTKYLTLLAVLCRKDGETLPVDEVEREQFISDRVALFGGSNGEIINAGTAIDVDFFLTPFSGRYSKNNPVFSSLYLQSLKIAALVTLRRTPLRKQQPKNTANKFLNGSGGVRSFPRSSRRGTLKPPKKPK